MINFKESCCGLPEWILGNTNYVFYGDLTDEMLENTKYEINIIKSNWAGEEKTFWLNNTYYKSTANLLQQINALKDISFKSTQDKNDYVMCELSKKAPAIVRFSEQLANILGFRNQSIALPEKNATARHRVDRYPGTNCFLIFTDFIEDSFVGDSQVSLLRAVPFNEIQQNNVMSFQCYPFQYKKVVLREIPSIRILITDDTGRKIRFQNRGRVFLTLHFRPRRR